MQTFPENFGLLVYGHLYTRIVLKPYVRHDIRTDMKSVRFEMRLEPAELEQWKADAESNGQSLSNWVRERCSVRNWGMNEVAVRAGHVQEKPNGDNPKRERTPRGGGVGRRGVVDGACKHGALRKFCKHAECREGA